MRAENDLRDAVHARADLAPTHVDLPVAGAAERQRRRPFAIATAVVATAAVAGSCRRSLDPRWWQSPAGRELDEARSIFGIGDDTAPPPPSLIDSTLRISYAGTGVNDMFQTAQAQYIELNAPGFQTREISAYTPGLFHKSLIRDARPVTVNGVHGYFGGALPWRNDDVSHTDPAHTDPRGSKYATTTPTLAWQVGTRWISVSSDVPGEGTVAGLKAIAANVRTSNDPVRTPIKIGYLPGGYQLADVDHSRADNEYAGSTSLIGFRRNDKYDYWDWDVSLTPPLTKFGRRVMAPAHPIYPELSRKVGKYTLTVETLGAISTSEAKKVLASVTIAGDPSSPNDSWFDVAQALP